MISLGRARQYCADVTQMDTCDQSSASTAIYNGRISNSGGVSKIETLQSRLAPLRQSLADHPIYLRLLTLKDVQVFMESHVFAVWDFMTLVKALQIGLTCVTVPWLPSKFRSSRRFINEIVLGEESDKYEGQAISHFELYLDAMERAGANTQLICGVLEEASRGINGMQFHGVPVAAREFVKSTFKVVSKGSLAAQAAAFAFGREDAIPDMFRLLVGQLNQELAGELDLFVWYLERHIEVDGNEHGPLALKMVSDLCGDNEDLWEEATQAALAALQARIKLWDGVLDLIAA